MRPNQLFCLLGLALPVSAQGGDPMEEIKAIFARVEKEMHEIDKLLLDAGTQNAAAKLQQNIDSLQKLLENAEQKQRAVIDGIDQILEKVPQKNKNQQNQQNQNRNQQNQQDQDQEQQDQRRDSQTPDMQEQQQNREQRSDQQRNEGPDPVHGENRDAQRPPHEDATGNAVRDDLDREWGELPEYIRKRHMKGETPKIPLRYERYWLEYVRRNSKVQDGGK